MRGRFGVYWKTINYLFREYAVYVSKTVNEGKFIPIAQSTQIFIYAIDILEYYLVKNNFD